MEVLEEVEAVVDLEVDAVVVVGDFHLEEVGVVTRLEEVVSHQEGEVSHREGAEDFINDFNLSYVLLRHFIYPFPW